MFVSALHPACFTSREPETSLIASHYLCFLSTSAQLSGFSVFKCFQFTSHFLVIPQCISAYFYSFTIIHIPNSLYVSMFCRLQGCIPAVRQDRRGEDQLQPVWGCHAGPGTESCQRRSAQGPGQPQGWGWEERYNLLGLISFISRKSLDWKSKHFSLTILILHNVGLCVATGGSGTCIT